MPPKLFKKGDKIEVRMPDDRAVWCPAMFIQYSADQIHVKFETSVEIDDPTSPLRRAYVDAGDVRPAPPPELHRYLKVGEIVEGFCQERNGWVKGKVVEILENSRYTVSFEGEDSHVVVEQWELRAVREWIHGSWNPPFLLQEVLKNKTNDSGVKSTGLKLRIKCSRKQPEMKFDEGMLVEVKSDMEGFLGSWFTAVIVKPLRNGRFLVEYRTLRTEDSTEYLKEETGVSCIRYNPPVIQRVKPYEYLEHVDVSYNDGWWEGYICQVLNGSKYMIHFMYTHEEMVFEHCQLRPHQEWIDGKWCADLKVDLADMKLKSDASNLKRKHSQTVTNPLTFEHGMMVEVKSDEEGYQGSWYTAVVVSTLSSDDYLVEYQTLRTEDESELLREKAIGPYIRPCPPKIERFDSYKMLEQVDAWYNEGWWVGLVSKVLDDRKYGVYFWTTNEELYFDHFNLRPHQEWTGGKWIVSSKKKPKLLQKNKLGKCKGEHTHTSMGEEMNFMTRQKVEVKSDDQIYRNSWFPAVIIQSLGRRKYLVEYQTLRTDDGTHLHKEEADALCIRPCPPIVQRKDPFKPCEEVDAWHNGGWWMGQICKALPRRKYAVYFVNSGEILEFEHSDLRPYQEWKNGQWVFAKLGSKSCSN